MLTKSIVSIVKFASVICIMIASVICIMNSLRIKNSFSKEMSSTDQNFRDSGWAGHQVGIIEFKDLSSNDWKHMSKQINKRFLDPADISAELYSFQGKTTSEKWLNLFLRNPCDQNRTFCLALFEKEKMLIFIANHALCDGHSIYRILTICLGLQTPINMPQYRRMPIISELSVLRYGLERVIANIGYSPLPIEKVNRRYSVFLPYYGKGRWEVMGTIFHCIYQSLIFKVSSIRIAFTVGWDDDETTANNRIGGIIIDIPRKSNPTEYSELIKNEMLKRKNDALISYEIVRNYSVKKLRKKFCHSIDGVCTLFPVKDCVYGVSKWFGGFAGNLKAPFYLNAVTYTQEPSFLALSIQTCTPYFDENLFLKHYPKATDFNHYKFPVP